jgi:hypothetical protein
MAIELERAYLAGSDIVDGVERVDGNNELWTITLTSDLKSRLPLHVPHSLYAIVVLKGGEIGEQIWLTGYFAAPKSEIAPSITYKTTWQDKGRHIAIIRLAGNSLYFTGNGDYKIRFTLNGSELGTINFKVAWVDAVPGTEIPNS